MACHHHVLNPVVVLALLLVVPFISSCCCAVDPASIPGCEPARCGTTRIAYPFWLVQPTASPSSYCGDPRMGLTCVDNTTLALQTSIGSVSSSRFTVSNINAAARTVTLVHADAVQNLSCPRVLTNLTSDPSAAFSYSPSSDANITFFLNCTTELPGDIACLRNPDDSKHSYVLPAEAINSTYTELLGTCDRVVVVPVLRRALDAATASGLLLAALRLGGLLREGFEVVWKPPEMKNCRDCETQGGLCVYTNKSGDGLEFSCHCPDGTTSPTFCGGRGKGGMKVLIKISIGLAGGFFIVACVLISCLCKYSTRLQNLFGMVDEDQTIEAFLEKHGPLSLARYRYSSIKKITSSFTEKLGEGGYGSVFKGKLDDGSIVAVKILNDIKGSGEDFINEVASIGRTNHVNIVSLLGFCSDGSRRALIYEYMSNGSLEKYLFHKNVNTTPLGWEQLYKIAIGIAKGLEYLHRGCKTRIVHFDIKPHNILLDEEMCPKISDFGLAKFCPPKESILSMVCARGTIGYIAPEVFSRSFGVVTSKADVYSYGMMILEMVGGRKNSDRQVDNTSEMYFPHWIYEHLDKINELKIGGTTNETEEVAKKMVLVGLWCIQANPSSRPSISRVVDMLEGRVEDLPMPPKQYLCSPPRLDPPTLESYFSLD